MNLTIRLASEPTFDSVVDGPGIRTVIWTQGCPHNCKECHNPGTHDYLGGFQKDIDSLLKEILSVGHNVTFSGGDPFVQPYECGIIAKALKEAGHSSWAYSGWTFEELLNKSIQDRNILTFLENIDYLVDGPFIIKKRTLSMPYRGSSNQRIIDVSKSLKAGTAIEDKTIGEELKVNSHTEGIFI